MPQEPSLVSWIRYAEQPRPNERDVQGRDCTTRREWARTTDPVGGEGETRTRSPQEAAYVPATLPEVASNRGD